MDKLDTAELDAMLARLRPLALSVAFRIVKDRDDAEDAVQNGYFSICSKRDGMSNPVACTLRAVQRCALRLLDQRNNGRIINGDIDEDGQVTPDFAESATLRLHYAWLRQELLDRPGEYGLTRERGRAFVALLDLPDGLQRDQAALAECYPEHYTKRLNQARETLAELGVL